MKTYKIASTAGYKGDGQAFADIAEGLVVSIRYVDGRSGQKIDDVESFAKKRPDFTFGICRDDKFCVPGSQTVAKNTDLKKIVQARLKQLDMTVQDLYRKTIAEDPNHKGVLDQSIYDWFADRIPSGLSSGSIEKILKALDLEVRPCAKKPDRLALSAAPRKGRS